MLSQVPGKGQARACLPSLLVGGHQEVSMTRPRFMVLCRFDQGRIPLGHWHLPAVALHFLQGIVARPSKRLAIVPPPPHSSNSRISCDVNKIGAPVWKLTRSAGICNCGTCPYKYQPVKQVNTLHAWARRCLLVGSSRYRGRVLGEILDP
jgi:hypothetical protein